MKAVAATCWTVKVASASMARISSGDCCGGATVDARTSALHAVKLSHGAREGRHICQGLGVCTYILQTW